MKVLFVGRYAPGSYVRGDILRKGLEQNGVETVLFLGTGPLKYLKIALRVLKNDYDCLIATGTLTFLFSRIFCRKPVVFDAFISNYDTLVYDRRLVRKGSLKAKLLWLGDKYACELSAIAIFDTAVHRDYFIEEFSLDRKSGKYEVIPVGADDSIYYPAKDEEKDDSVFNVLFYGNYIPLHGVEYIIRAAKILEDEKDIRFRLLGSGQTLEENKRLAQELNAKNLTFTNERVDGDPQGIIGKVDLCLGIFGDTDKARRVIPTKAYQIIAMKKPLLTGDSPASRETFTDGENALLCRMADPQALAAAILALKNNPALSRRIAEGGYALYLEKYTPKVLGARLKSLLSNLNP